ncbi:hypothetical protein N9370_03950 [Paracoccaceae bacterium]|nr:hypothetical protein [Paracoccaceae bacterium]
MQSCQTYASNLDSNSFTDWSSVELRIRSEGIQIGGEAFTADLLYASKLSKPPKNVSLSSPWMFNNLTQPKFVVDISNAFFKTLPLSLDAELPLNRPLENLIARQVNILKVGANVESALASLDKTEIVPQLEIIGHNFK